MKGTAKQVLTEISQGNISALNLAKKGNKAVLEKYGLNQDEVLVFFESNGQYYNEHRTFTESEYQEIYHAYSDDGLIKIIVIEL